MRSSRRIFSHMVDGLFDILLPCSCIACGQTGGVVCGRCLEGLTGVSLGSHEYEPEPEGRPFRFSEWRAAGAYSGLLREMVIQLKSSRAAFAEPLSDLMIQAGGNKPGYLEPDCICYVPSGRKKLHARGYNPAELLARGVAHRLSRPLSHMLEKRVCTPDQHGSSSAARRTNVEGAYSLKPAAVVRSRVLLIDDVLTTGATAEACARVLLSAGAASVRVLVAARSELRRSRP